MTGFIKELKKAYSRSYHYTQLGNAIQKHFFASSALIMGTLKRSTNRFLISVSKVKILQAFEWTRFTLTFPYGQKSMSTKRADIHGSFERF